MIPSSYIPDNEMAKLSARMLIEIGAIGFNSEKPYKLASGLPSPTYVDCRKLISFARIRATLMDFLTVKILRDVAMEKIDNIAGCLLYTSPSPRDKRQSRMPSSA